MVAGGLAFAVICIMFTAWVDVSIGKLHVLAALAVVGLLVIVAGGIFALAAITRSGGRSPGVFAALAVALFALLLIVAQFAFDVP